MINHSGGSHTSSGYASYLLRLWHTHSGGAAVWRASLEHPVTREVVRFDSLLELFAYLGAQTGQGSAGEGQARDLPLTRAP